MAEFCKIRLDGSAMAAPNPCTLKPMKLNKEGACRKGEQVEQDTLCH